MLELKNIHKSFGDVRVLNGTNLRLEKGFIYTLKGGNGSGKTYGIKNHIWFVKTLGRLVGGGEYLCGQEDIWHANFYYDTV